jgi:hypothetical protein
MDLADRGASAGSGIHRANPSVNSLDKERSSRSAEHWLQMAQEVD